MKLAITTAIAAALSKFKGSKKALDLGISEDIINAVSSYLSKDIELDKNLTEQIKNAQDHDISIGQKLSKLVINLRGLIRPLCTIVILTWYLYAKLNNINLTTEDYSIIGGVLAFWFGFRTYEKKNRIF